MAIIIQKIRKKVRPAGDISSVRVKTMGAFGEDFPETAKVIFDWALNKTRKRDYLSFTVPELPPSVNHMYIQVGHARRVLSPEAQTFRELVTVAIGSKRHDWKPKGVVMAMVFLQSPFWINKKHQIRDADGDNRLKSLMDAVQVTTGISDNTNWEFHVWKVPSGQKRTTVYMFDLGDVVEYYK